MVSVEDRNQGGGHVVYFKYKIIHLAAAADPDHRNFNIPEQLHHPNISKRYKMNHPAFFSTVLYFSTLSIAFAATVVWDGGASGSFSDVSSWVGPSIPGTADTAEFAEAGDVAVSFSQNAKITDLLFNNTQVGFDPATLTFNLGTNEFEVTTAIQVIASSASAERAFVVNGGKFTAVRLDLNMNSGTVLPVSATFHGVDFVNTGSMFIAGNNTQGTLIFSGGSTAAIGASPILGHRGNSDARMRVTGTGTVVTAASRVSLDQGTSLLEVLDGGRVLSSGNSIEVGRNSNSIATVLVSGNNSRLEATNASHGLFVGGVQTGTAGGVASVTFTNGGIGEFDHVRVFGGNTLVFNVGYDSEFNPVILQSGGVDTSTANFDANATILFGLVGDGQTVDLTVDGLLTLDGSILDALFATDYTPVVGDSFSLIEYGSLTGLFGNANDQVIVGDTILAIDYNFGGANVIGLTVVPEPHHAALFVGLLGFGWLICRRRRR